MVYRRDMGPLDASGSPDAKSTGKLHFCRRSKCPACGAEERKTLFRAPYDEGPVFEFVKAWFRGAPTQQWLQGGEYWLVRCEACSLVYQVDVGSEELLEEVYNRWLNDGMGPDDSVYTQEFLARPRCSRDGHELLAASRALNVPIPSMRVLDFGMGWALWGRVALALGCTVHGFDLSEERNAFARKHGILVADKARPEQLGVNFVSAEQVFEHLTNPAEELAWIARAMAPGGIVKISVPAAPSAERLVSQCRWDDASRVLMMPIFPIEHVNCFNGRSLDALARRSGLVPMRIPLRASYHYLALRDAVPMDSPIWAAKELVRPLHRIVSRSSLYRWYRKP